MCPRPTTRELWTWGPVSGFLSPRLRFRTGGQKGPDSGWGAGVSRGREDTAPRQHTASSSVPTHSRGPSALLSGEADKPCRQSGLGRRGEESRKQVSGRTRSLSNRHFLYSGAKNKVGFKSKLKKNRKTPKAAFQAINGSDPCSGCAREGETLQEAGGGRRRPEGHQCSCS